jgi:hypothetical protein
MFDLANPQQGWIFIDNRRNRSIDYSSGSILSIRALIRVSRKHVPTRLG